MNTFSVNKLEHLFPVGNRFEAGSAKLSRAESVELERRLGSVDKKLREKLPNPSALDEVQSTPRVLFDIHDRVTQVLTKREIKQRDYLSAQLMQARIQAEITLSREAAALGEANLCQWSELYDDAKVLRRAFTLLSEKNEEN